MKYLEQSTAIQKSCQSVQKWGSIKPVLIFRGRFSSIRIKFENNSNIIVLYIKLTIYGETFITNSACAAKITKFVETT